MSNQFDFDELWDFSDPTATEMKFRELLESDSVHPHRDYMPELKSQIARTLSLQRRFEEAHTFLDALEPTIGCDQTRPRARYLLERGRTFNSSGVKEKAGPLFIEAWEIAKANGHDLIAVDAAHMVAFVVSGEEELSWNRKALALAESSEDSRAQRWVGSLYNNIGWAYHDMGDYDAALDIFQRATNWQAAHGAARNLRIAEWSVSRTLRSLGRVDEALKRQLAQLQELEAQGEKPGYTYEEVGECLLLLDRAEEAKPYFAAAFEVLSQDPWLQANESSRLERLRELGGAD